MKNYDHLHRELRNHLKQLESMAHETKSGVLSNSQENVAARSIDFLCTLIQRKDGSKIMHDVLNSQFHQNTFLSNLARFYTIVELIYLPNSKSILHDYSKELIHVLGQSLKDNAW